MDNFAKLDAAERTPFFEETASRRSSTTTAVEKDFWVCWTLKHLFALKHVPELRFKGGTSLSKVFRLIDRFSEDIDISVDRAALGFTGERDLAHPQLSTTKRKALDVELREAITKEVARDLLPKLRASFEPILKKQKWMLVPSEEANEEMTLVFYYPRAFDYKDYLRPQIKLEFGRGDQQPCAVVPLTGPHPKSFGPPTNRGQIQSRADAYFQDIAARSGNPRRPQTRGILVSHRQVDEARQNIFRVQTHENGSATPPGRWFHTTPSRRRANRQRCGLRHCKRPELQIAARTKDRSCAASL
jgi:hypothetical protein